MTTESTPGALGSNDQLGAGDARYCYSTEDREDVLRKMWPESIAG